MIMPANGHLIKHGRLLTNSHLGEQYDVSLCYNMPSTSLRAPSASPTETTLQAPCALVFPLSQQRSRALASSLAFSRTIPSLSRSTPRTQSIVTVPNLTPVSCPLLPKAKHISVAPPHFSVDVSIDLDSPSASIGALSSAIRRAGFRQRGTSPCNVRFRQLFWPYTWLPFRWIHGLHA